MSENLYINYLKYVRDVLGVQAALTDVPETSLGEHFFNPDPELKLEQIWDLVFVNAMFASVESIFETAAQELFQKMLTAMKLKDKKVLVVDTDLVSEKEILRRWRGFTMPKVLVIFKDHPEMAPELRWIDDTSVVETYSPYHLQHHPEFKKITWNHLQKVMDRLKLD